MAYTFLLSRFQLSRRNGWVNDHGEVFVIFPHKELARELRICEQRVTAAFHKLVELKLVWEKRCGWGDANQIYLAQVQPEDNPDYSCTPFLHEECYQEPQDLRLQNLKICGPVIIIQVKREQLHILVREKFRRPDMEITAARMEAMLRQLRYAMGDICLDDSAVWLGEIQPDSRRLEAVDVMLELADGRPQEFSSAVRSPELLRFTLEGNSLRMFTVVTLSDPLAAIDPNRPGRTVWISDSGTFPPGLTLPPKHFFAARQSDGSHRFYGS